MRGGCPYHLPGGSKFCKKKHTTINQWGDYFDRRVAPMDRGGRYPLGVVSGRFESCVCVDRTGHVERPINFGMDAGGSDAPAGRHLAGQDEAAVKISWLQRFQSSCSTRVRSSRERERDEIAVAMEIGGHCSDPADLVFDRVVRDAVERIADAVRRGAAEARRAPPPPEDRGGSGSNGG